MGEAVKNRSRSHHTPFGDVVSSRMLEVILNADKVFPSSQWAAHLGGKSYRLWMHMRGPQKNAALRLMPGAAFFHLEKPR